MTDQAQRLPPPHGRLIDRERVLAFTFEGRSYQGFEGDTIASALAANGRWLMSRSFKYHRPRGPFSFWGHDANAIVQIGAEPNVTADRRRLEDGMAVIPVNVNGSLRRDRGAWLGPFGRFLPVGFYYKAFYRPRGVWGLWERVIRNRAGLGAVDRSHHHGYFDKEYAWCDVCVVGGGAAGTSAAFAAAAGGGEVILIDDQPTLGGALNFHRFGAEAEEPRRDDLPARVVASPNIRVLADTTCTGWFADHYIAAVRGNRLFKIRARATVVATGVIDQPLVCRNNDLPGVVSVAAAQRLIRLWGVRPGARAVVVAGTDDAYGAALDLAEAGVTVAAVLELRPAPPEEPRAAAVAARGIRILAGHAPRQFLGRLHVNGVEAAPVTGEGELGPGGEAIACDLVCVGVGAIPAAHLLCHAGARIGYDEAAATFRVEDIPDGLFAAGAANGVHDLEAVAAHGAGAGWQAARHAGLEVGAWPPPMPEPAAAAPGHPWPIFPHPRGKDFVDFDEDLQVADILNAAADGFDHVQLLKRYSTAGMGPSQGRHSSLATSRLAAKAMGASVDEAGTTTWRPPYIPESFGHLTGRSFQPVRHTAMHHRHLKLGAEMMLAGLWLRPAYYAHADGRAAAVHDEALAVRNNLGLIDVSTLGGLEIRGPDAAEFMNRMYTFAYLKQPVGRARYVLMTDETGVVVDDGVACRLHDDHFYTTATTGNVEGVYRQMLFWNAQWRLDVDVTHVTSTWCGVNLAGPKSRDVLAELCGDVDLGVEAFPYMGVRTGTVAGLPARLIRVGFVGELGYEIHVPAGYGEALWDAMMAAGRAAGIRPFGVEAQRLLRLEKGHIIIGQDTDGLTTPQEAAMSWAVSRRKPFFVGGRAVAIREKRPLTRQLVGFEVTADSPTSIEECQLVLRGDEITGRVTSVSLSPTLGKVIGLAYVAPDQAQAGSVIEVKAAGGARVSARVVELPFYDPENRRQEL